MSWYHKSMMELGKYGHTKTKSILASYGVGWVSLRVPQNIAKKCISFAKQLNEDDVYHEMKDNKDEYGLELHPHITVKYGIKTKSANKIKDVINTKKGGKVRLGTLSIFESDDYDVLKVSVTGSVLHRLHKTLTDELNIPDTYPEYHPHVTIAYMKKDKAKEYIGDDIFDGLTFECTEVVFEDADDNKTTIQLQPY